MEVDGLYEYNVVDNGDVDETEKLYCNNVVEYMSSVVFGSFAGLQKDIKVNAITVIKKSHFIFSLNGMSRISLQINKSI